MLRLKSGAVARREGGEVYAHGIEQLPDVEVRQTTEVFIHGKPAVIKQCGGLLHIGCLSITWDGWDALGRLVEQVRQARQYREAK